MYIFILLIRIAAFFGHRKARLMVEGQKAISMENRQITFNGKQIPKGVVWIHVASVGEFEQARPLIEKSKIENPSSKIVLTFFSPSGYELRKNYDKVDAVLYLPFPTRSNAKRFLDCLQPKMAIFVKYEFWPAYLKELKKYNIKTYSISAIFRPNQLFFRPWGKWYLRLLGCFTHIYVQDNDSLQLLRSHGVQHCSVAGDTRFDRVKEIKDRCADRVQSTDRLAPIAEFAEGAERVIVGGSTWPKDEVLLSQYIGHLSFDMGDLSTKLILVPHEIDEEHLHFIFRLFNGRIVKYSAVSGALSAESRRNILMRAQVLVIDKVGLLSSIYTFGHTAYIGGGFGVGIHNTIEAAVYGLPVIFGPNHTHFREAVGLINAGAARSIKTYSELEAALDTALSNHETIGAKAAEYVESELGATDKIYNEIFINH